MVKVPHGVALAMLLGACGTSDRPAESSKDRRQPPFGASTDASKSPDIMVNNMPVDPEARYGIVKTPLGGRAFNVKDFGSAPEGNAASAIRGLEPLARAGDGKASYEIYLKISQCMPLIGLSRRARSSLDAKSEEECRDIPVESLAAKSDWLRRGAEQGHLGAQLVFVADPEQALGGLQEIFKNPDVVIEYKRQAMEYLESAADRGSMDALLRLGNAHQVGVMTEQDNTTSYAYYLAAERAAPGTVSSNRQQWLRDRLSVEQIRESKVKAEEIYDECCTTH
ncbi:sel1 repeat family protein [Stenotrophomonas bentonitica]|nr:sel1 repeat family protein [Stenotrophomonas bentonitica]